MTLPRLLLLTDRRQVHKGSVVEVVAAAIDGGARAVVLRERDLPTPQRTRLASELRELLGPVGGILIAATPAPAPAPAPDRRFETQLRGGDSMPSTRPAVVGRSCHDAVELANAEAENCDYATLSPVATSASKPGYGPAIGAERFSELVSRTRIPVFALGGVTPENAATWIAAGAYGIAVMGTVMRAVDPAGTTSALLTAIDRAREEVAPA